MRILKSEITDKRKVTNLKGLKVTINEAVYKPKSIMSIAMAINSSTKVDEIGTKVHLLEWLMPNFMYIHRIECQPNEVDKATDKMLDIYNNHMRNLKLA